MEGLPGLRLTSSLRGHSKGINKVAWSGDAKYLSTAADDGKVCVWKLASGEMRVAGSRPKSTALSTAWSPDGQMVAGGWSDGHICAWAIGDLSKPSFALKLRSPAFAIVWHPNETRLVCGLRNGNVLSCDVERGKTDVMYHHSAGVRELSWSRDGLLASAGADNRVLVYAAALSGELRCSDVVNGVDWHPSGRLIAVGTDAGTIIVWEAAGPSGFRQLATVEGHRGAVNCVAYSRDGSILVSKSDDGTVRFWDAKNFTQISELQEATSKICLQGLSFSSEGDYLATRGERDGVVRIWRFDASVLVSEAYQLGAIRHKTAKVVLVGDSGVGKTSLGWRLAGNLFRTHEPTHGQQFWLLPALKQTQEDTTRCEVVLWDLAGQSEYRLIHSLFIDDADMALVLFDPTDLQNSFRSVEFWLTQLRGDICAPSSAVTGGTNKSSCPIILVAARADRVSGMAIKSEIERFCQPRMSNRFVITSAKTGLGIAELMAAMREMMPWEQHAPTVTTAHFQAIKDYCLKLKERREKTVIVNYDHVRTKLEEDRRGGGLSNAELDTVVGHLQKHGFVRKLQTSTGESHILTAPELLNNLAASFVLEAGRNDRGLGSLDQQRLLMGGYLFPELQGLAAAERETLLDATTLVLLTHNICFRETDPLTGKSYIVFPSLISQVKPSADESVALEDGPAYAVTGATKNIYASLVVLLGYTPTFTRTAHWHNQARYGVSGEQVCGFRLETELDGRLDLVVYFGTNVRQSLRNLFQGLLESFLVRDTVEVTKFERVICPGCQAPLERSVAIAKSRAGKRFAYCSDCGGEIRLVTVDVSADQPTRQSAQVSSDNLHAKKRSTFEGILFKLANHFLRQRAAFPSCFISYAWGDAGQENWVEHVLAADLGKAGVRVILDRWENSRIGSSIARFVERIEKCDYVVVVGTPLYRKKYENPSIGPGYVVAAEADLIANRMLGTEERKATVLPLLLAGDKSKSLPALLQGRVHADFRDRGAYFEAAFDLILSLYAASPDIYLSDLRKTLTSKSIQ